jgi:hypothetical protein
VAGVSFALSGIVGTRLIQHMHAQTQRRFVQHCQRPNGHAALNAGVFNHRGRNAFTQHGCPFHHKRAKSAAGVKPAGVVHHNRDLAQRLHVIKGAGDRLVIGLFAADDFHQLHLVHRAEEMDADKFFGLALALAKPEMGSVDVLDAKNPPSPASARPPA